MTAADADADQMISPVNHHRRGNLKTAAAIPAVAAVNEACPGDWEGWPSRADPNRHRGDNVLR